VCKYVTKREPLVIANHYSRLHNSVKIPKFLHAPDLGVAVDVADSNQAFSCISSQPTGLNVEYNI
jgi:hypothetical protein